MCSVCSSDAQSEAPLLHIQRCVCGLRMRSAYEVCASGMRYVRDVCVCDAMARVLYAMQNNLLQVGEFCISTFDGAGPSEG